MKCAQGTLFPEGGTSTRLRKVHACLIASTGAPTYEAKLHNAPFPQMSLQSSPSRPLRTSTVLAFVNLHFKTRNSRKGRDLIPIKEHPRAHFVETTASGSQRSVIAVLQGQRDGLV